MNISNFSSIFSSNCTDPPHHMNSVNIVAYCYVLPAICAIGILGNIANLITLFSRRLRAVSYIYLRGLGLADLLCMIFVLVFVLFEVLAAMGFPYSYSVAWYRAHLMLPLINWSVSAGILIIVALTLERYLSVSWPLLFRQWNSPRRAVGIVIVAYVIALALYVPMCWQSVVVEKVIPINIGCGLNGTGNGSMGIMVMRRLTTSDNKLLLDSSSYKAYKLTRETLLKFVPITALSILNLRIIFVFKKVRRRRRRLNNNSSSNSQNSREQRSLLFLLAGIVVLFFICNIPAAINLLFITEKIKTHPSYGIFRAIANLLEITNHALNFYNFCLCSSDYRMTFLRKFPCVKAVQESADNLKRRFSNSFMKFHGSRKSEINRSIRVHTCQLATSSLRTQAHANPASHLLRRAVSSDALLKIDPSSFRPYRRFRAQISTATVSPKKEISTVNNCTSNLGVINEISGKRWKNDRRKYYASSESFQIFDAIPEDTSRDQLATTSAAGTEERKSSFCGRPTVSAIELGEMRCTGDYATLMTDTSGTRLSPAIDTGGSSGQEEKRKKVTLYDPNSDIFL